MIKIDISKTEKCEKCLFCQIAFDSDLFETGEPYCCVDCESVQENMENGSKPQWCPLIECND